MSRKGEIWDIVEPVSQSNLKEATIIFLGFFLFQYLGALLVPPIKRAGYSLKEGKPKLYKLTGI